MLSRLRLVDLLLILISPMLVSNAIDTCVGGTSLQVDKRQNINHDLDIYADCPPYNASFQIQ